MSELDQEKIQVLAHQLWERDGCPEGKADDYWHAAVELLSDEGREAEVDEPGPVLPIPPARL
mgnify:CR=1 FL=1